MIVKRHLLSPLRNSIIVNKIWALFPVERLQLKTLTFKDTSNFGIKTSNTLFLTIKRPYSKQPQQLSSTIHRKMMWLKKDSNSSGLAMMNDHWSYYISNLSIQKLTNWEKRAKTKNPMTQKMMILAIMNKYLKLNPIRIKLELRIIKQEVPI